MTDSAHPRPTPDTTPDVLASQDAKALLQRGFEDTTTAAQAPGARWQPPAPADLAGLVANLEVQELIGQGGMGAVYRAVQTHLDRPVALKILPRGGADDPDFATRFAREARALARLNHPHLVTIHDYGQSERWCWLVMELVDGANLREVMRTGRLSPQQALAIVPQLCDALQYAHDEGVVHRDIKPENILLDAHGRVKIADFGLAKLRQPESPTSQVLTGSGDRVGTVHYMAPEQVEGARDVDHRADIFSLGVVFYEMLTGGLPLGRFEPPSRRVEIDVRLDDVVLKALEKDPARRYQQASEVQRAVEAADISQPETAAGGEAQVPDAPATQHLSYSIVALVILVAGLATFGGAAWVGLHGPSAGPRWLGLACLLAAPIMGFGAWCLHARVSSAWAVLGILVSSLPIAWWWYHAMALAVIAISMFGWALFLPLDTEEWSDHFARPVARLTKGLTALVAVIALGCFASGVIIAAKNISRFSADTQSLVQDGLRWSWEGPGQAVIDRIADRDRLRPAVAGSRFQARIIAAWTGVEGTGALTLWVELADGRRFFSRQTLDRPWPSGNPMSTSVDLHSGTGDPFDTIRSTDPGSTATDSRGWRELVLPFDTSGSTSPITVVSIEASLPGAGRLRVRTPILLEENLGSPTSRAASEPEVTMPASPSAQPGGVRMPRVPAPEAKSEPTP